MNKVVITGNLCGDPQLSTTNSGLSVCKFTVAVQRKYKNDNNEYESDFLNVVAWRSTADFVSKYLRKGNRVGVVGSIQTRTYEGNDGTKKYITEIIADEVESYTPKAENTNKTKTEASVKQEVMQKFEPIESDSLPFENN